MRSRQEKRIINSLQDVVRLDIDRCNEIAKLVVELKRLKALETKLRTMQLEYNQSQEEHGWLHTAIGIISIRIDDYVNHCQDNVKLLSE